MLVSKLFHKIAQDKIIRGGSFEDRTHEISGI